MHRAASPYATLVWLASLESNSSKFCQSIVSLLIQVDCTPLGRT